MEVEKNVASNIIRVKLLKQKKYGLGFLVRKRSRAPHVVVSDLVSHGMAAESGLVQIGDVILKVNDVDFEQLVYEKSIEMLKSLPVNAPVVLILKGPEGYTSHLETWFAQDGTPKTIRITKPVLQQDSLIGRIRKTFSAGTSRSCRTKQTQANCECHKTSMCQNGDMRPGLVTLQDGDTKPGLVTCQDGETKPGLVNGDVKHDITNKSRGTETQYIPDILDAQHLSNAGGIEANNYYMQHNNNSIINKDVPPSDIDNNKGSVKPSINGSNDNLRENGIVNGGESRVPLKQSDQQNKTSSVKYRKSSNISDDISVFTDEERNISGNEIKSNISSFVGIQRNGTQNIPDINKTVGKQSNMIQTASGIKAVTQQTEGVGACLNANGSAGSGNTGSKKDMEDTSLVKKTLEVNHKMERLTSPVKKFVKLRHVGEERPVCSDTLHTKAIEPMPCTPSGCMGSIMDVGVVSTDVRSKEDVLTNAQDFINKYYQSLKRSNSPAHTKRWAEVETSVRATGTYELTTAELTYGAKSAWRNAPRCIGRIQWSKLQVFDARHITTARGMFEAICNHIKYATNKGNIRSAITVFPPRTDGKHDFRVWNQQFIRYAGYKQEDGTVVGDPANVEITQVCQKMGWKGKGTRFDVLPLILQANGHDPEMFQIPQELILEVNLKHPKFPWFADMGLKWYSLPAVSNMAFDCGGLVFTGAPFNGWFMGTEIGARDLTDKFRYNLLEDIAKRMGFDTRKSSSLWKDRTLVEINVAVLHSFQSQGVTITDHHAASESFMKHLDNEQKLRGGCPADWVWVVPPMSASILSVFHQEMLSYKLKPSYEYQADAWKTHVWKKDKERNRSISDRPRRKIGFRELARAVKFSAKLMGKALARRVRCKILYATETGKSEGFAKILCQIFKHAFDPKVVCMDECDVSELEHEQLVLIVTSTFGNGDPPENGEKFAKFLYEAKHPDVKDKLTKQKSYLRLSVSNDQDDDSVTSDSNNSHVTEHSNDSMDKLALEMGPFSNLRYSVFGLGSSAYPNFCQFGHYLDNMFEDLGAERVYKMMEGDELCGQEESFRTWAKEVFKAACETFCTGDERSMQDATGALSTTDHHWTPDTFRVTPASGMREPDILSALSTVHNKSVIPCRFIEKTQLQSQQSDRQTLLVKLDSTLGSSELLYQPGDHVAIYPENSQKLVDAILIRLHNAPAPDQLIKIEVMTERSTPLGTMKSWDAYTKVPACTLRNAFSRYLDITTPPSQALLKLLSTQASKDCDRDSLENLAQDSHLYEEWKYDSYPNIVHVLDQFPSLRIPASLLLTQLPLLQSRFYSISSSLKLCPGEIHATVAVVKYRTQGNTGPLHEGVCSNWLSRLEEGDTIPCVVRHAPSFHLPDDPTVPIILVGPGTGIAPFRSFWQQRKIDMEMLREPERGTRKGWGDMYLYFGCRNSNMDAIYKTELEQMKSEGVLKEVYTALSREPDTPKMYVQNILKENSKDVFRCIVKENGHFYVCGDVKMASDVTATLEKILAIEGNMAVQDAKSFVLKLRDGNRFHEDIFGVTLRSSEVTDRARDQAKRAWNFINSTNKSRPDIDKETVAPLPSGDRKVPKGKPKAPRKAVYTNDSVPGQ